MKKKMQMKGREMPKTQITKGRNCKRENKVSNMK